MLYKIATISFEIPIAINCNFYCNYVAAIAISIAISLLLVAITCNFKLLVCSVSYTILYKELNSYYFIIITFDLWAKLQFCCNFHLHELQFYCNLLQLPKPKNTVYSFLTPFSLKLQFIIQWFQLLQLCYIT